MMTAIPHPRWSMIQWFRALATVACSVSLCAAQPQERMPLRDAPAGTVLRDDDDGLVEVVPLGGQALQRLSAKRFHGGDVLPEPRVHLVFLGQGWAGPEAEGRQRKLREEMVGFGVSERFAGLRRYGLQNASFPVVTDLPVPLEPARLGDLGIQRALHAALLLGRIPPPTANSIYVVFPSPGMECTLGGRRAGKDFCAYHSSFHGDQGLVHYVVVPHAEPVDEVAEAAREALTLRILNPDGRGWY